LERLAGDGIKEVVIQPTHIMDGFEYDDLCGIAAEYRENFDSLEIGAPLLYSDEDIKRAVEVLSGEIEEIGSKDTAVVFMGHGTHHEADAVYGKLQDAFEEAGFKNVFIGTVEGAAAFENVLEGLKGFGANKVILYPFMIVAGDHAENDMAGDGPDSWKNMLEAEGYETECRLRGLGESEGVRGMILEHLEAAMG